jgi:transcriptional regulator with XRE-family HTH domain
MVTPAQSRAGRALLMWSQSELARRSHLSLSTIRDFETGKREPAFNNLAAIEKALVEAGVRLLSDEAGLGIFDGICRGMREGSLVFPVV